MNSPNISIVIPSTGDLKNLDRLLVSILKQRTEELSYEVVVVINGIADSERHKFQEIINKFNNYKFEFIKNKNASTARNFGIASSKSDLLLFLDDDSELLGINFLINYYKLFNNLPSDIFAIGGGYVCDSNAGFFDKIYNYIQMNWFVSGKINSLGDAKYLLGGNFLINRNVINDQILFSDQIPYGGSENYFFASARSQGKTLRQVPIDVIHHTEESFFSIIKKTIKQGRGQAIVESEYNIRPDSEFDTKSKNLMIQNQLESQSESAPFYYLPFLLFYRYTFWYGYYKYQNKMSAFVLFIFSNIFRYLNSLRYKIVDKLKKD